MKKGKPESEVSPARVRLIQCLMAVLFLYLLFISLEIPLVFKTGNGLFEKLHTRSVLNRPVKRPTRKHERRMREVRGLSGLFFEESLFDGRGTNDEFSVFDRAAKRAIRIGKKTWDELISNVTKPDRFKPSGNSTEGCPKSVSVSGSDFSNRNRIMHLPCGITLGSHITVIGVPRWAHSERNPPISLLKDGDGSVMVSHFMIELQGTESVDSEGPPRILHINPRLKGDWSGKPVIEHNTCYRMQWGSPLRCNGSESKGDEETVDGQVKCEKWKLSDDQGSDESRSSWWLNRLISFSKTKRKHDWAYPFSEGKLFVLTLRAGMEGYHVNVDGRHITSFPYRNGFALEDATRLLINGDIDVHSIFAASLPSLHPSVAPHQYLDMSNIWKAPVLPKKPVDLFIGILSAGNHFAERMAVRKSWMQHKLIKSSKIMARFFVALHARQEVNIELKKEAEYFKDIVIVPYMDHYELVVLKTVAICEYGVREVAAKNIMKCDDDTFVRLDAIVEEIDKVGKDTSFYIGNINFNHKPLRGGKWAVAYEEWPEEYYPPYANGPGYVLSSNIAEFIIEELEERRLRLFKMEDVSMGMWVGKFNKLKKVTYRHSLNFCQFGCVEGYYTSHYQSPRQMICLWDKLQSSGNPSCCNMR